MESSQGGKVRQLPDVGCTRQDLAAAKLTETVRRALDREIARIEGKSNENAVYKVDVSRAQVFRSPVLAEMFPRHLFVDVPFRLRAGPALKGKEFLLAWGPSTISSSTFAFQKDTGASFELPAGNCYEAFARFLAERKVSLKSHKDAERIWAAYCCAAHGTQPSDAKHVQVNERTWRLNWHRVEGPRGVPTDYFYEITTTPEGTVSSGRLKSEPP